MNQSKHNPTVAMLLSLIVPGIGQFYNRDILRGMFWLIITPGFWIGSGGTLGWVCHVAACYTAYTRASEIMEEEKK
jgi:TM2 domain-containing membrane protein YozV